jgi:hypothetical protein
MINARSPLPAIWTNVALGLLTGAIVRVESHSSTEKET